MRSANLSPDGQLLVYAAFQGGRLRTSYTQSWTAVSRPPWMHALVVWPMGTTYGGGGRFVENRRLVLRGAREAHPEHPLHGIEVAPGEAPYHRSSEEVDGAQWSGRDQRNRLVFASSGRIFARTGGQDVELADFTAQSPDPQPPPEWATLPLPAFPSVTFAVAAGERSSGRADTATGSMSHFARVRSDMPTRACRSGST